MSKPLIYVSKFHLGIPLMLFILVTSPLCKGEEVLDWNQCVEETSRSNAELLSSKETLRASRYQTKAAMSVFFPEVTANATYDRANSTRSVPTSGTTTTLTTSSSDNFYSLTLNANQNLFAVFRDRARFDQVHANEELVLANLDETSADVSFDLKSAFSSVVYAQDSVRLTENIAKRRADNLKLVELRYEGGRENKGSYFLSKAAVSQANFETTQARNSIFVNRQSLMRILGRDNAGDIRITGMPPLAQPDSVTDFQSIAIQTPQHRRVTAQEQISAAALRVARAQFYPSLNLGASYGRQDNDWFPANKTWNVGLTFSVPIFNGGRDFFGSKAASSNLAAAFLNKQDVDRDIHTQLKLAYTRYMEAAEKLKVDEEFVHASSVRAEIARNKYNNGLLSFEDWDLIENDHINRQKTLLQSQRDRITAEAAWEQAQGKGVVP